MFVLTRQAQNSITVSRIRFQDSRSKLMSKTGKLTPVFYADISMTFLIIIVGLLIKDVRIAAIINMLLCCYCTVEI